jgi:predicted nucleotidyltransferase component of viral defense system
VLPVVHRCLTHGYGEALGAELACYSLEEIAAEKLRTLLQAQKRLENGGWLRDCSRDYYDL